MHQEYEFREYNPHSVWRRIDGIQEYLCITDAEMADIAELSVKRFQYLKTQRRELGLIQLQMIADFFNLTPENLAYQLDFESLQARYNGTYKLPTRYLGPQTSTAKTIHNICKIGGKTFSDWLVKFLQLSPEHLKNSDKNPVNVFMVVDAITLLEIIKPGSASRVGHLNVISRLDDLQLLAQNHRVESLDKLYHVINDVLHSLVEYNWNYDANKIGRNSYNVSCKPIKATLDCFYGRNYSSPHYMSLQRGFGEAFPLVVGMPTMKSRVNLSSDAPSGHYSLEFHY